MKGMMVGDSEGLLISEVGCNFHEHKSMDLVIY